jgi:hypothetical protein
LTPSSKDPHQATNEVFALYYDVLHRATVVLHVAKNWCSRQIASNQRKRDNYFVDDNEKRHKCLPVLK